MGSGKEGVKPEAQEALGSWDNTVAVAEPKPHASARISIAEASSTWKNKKLNPVLEPTLAYRRRFPLLLRRFEAYSNHKGYLWIDQWKILADVEAFRFTWPHKQATAIATMVLLKEFFRYCLDNEWIPKNPAAKYKEGKPKKGSSEGKEDHKPFTEERMEEMLAACKKYGGPRYAWERAGRRRFYESLGRHRPAHQRHGNVRARSVFCPQAKSTYPGRKNGEKVSVWVEPLLQQRIRERARIHGPRIFGTFKSTDIDNLTNNWRVKCRAIWDMCAPWDEHDDPHPHRFRHTFARRILESDHFTFRDLAELLGDKEETVREYYSQWVPSRQNLLTEKMKKLHATRSSEKVVSIRSVR